jgi:hypothetical protein
MDSPLGVPDKKQAPGFQRCPAVFMGMEIYSTGTFGQMRGMGFTPFDGRAGRDI